MNNPALEGLILPVALLLDLAIGDPVFTLHPVRLIGRTAAFLENFLRKLLKATAAGICTWLLLMLIVLTSAFLFRSGLTILLGKTGHVLADILIIWTSIAVKDLLMHAQRIRQALEQDNLDAGRRQLSMIVGRDTEELDRAGVSRAAIESIAESFIDSCAAPLFWAALFGPFGALAFRTINTMDSMFGYKTERYLYFGRWAARADDAAAFIPARLASLLVCLLAPFFGGQLKKAVSIFLRDRKKHLSPNSAHGEAAFAGVLSLLLGGPSRYQRVLVEKPWLGSEQDGCRQPDYCDIGRAEKLMLVSSILCLFLLAVLRYGIVTGFLYVTALS